MKLYLGGHFAYYLPDHPHWVEIALPEETRLVEVLAGLDLPLGDVQLVVLNGEVVDLETTIVKDVDQVKLFPPVGGGQAISASR
jgi:sulfur carrier protein ThiS